MILIEKRTVLSAYLDYFGVLETTATSVTTPPPFAEEIRTVIFDGQINYHIEHVIHDNCHGHTSLHCTRASSAAASESHLLFSRTIQRKVHSHFFSSKNKVSSSL